MHRESDVYSPNGTTYRIGTADLANHITFMKTINAKLNTGSDWWIEIGHKFVFRKELFSSYLCLQVIFASPYPSSTLGLVLTLLDSGNGNIEV